MLFDLTGKRRRTVQATYLVLAVLMGGGLVLFGIGSDVSGGLFDAFSDRSGSGGGGSALGADRVAKAEERLRTSPHDEVALKDAARGHYELAADMADPNTGGFPPQARAELARAAGAWDRYLGLPPRDVDALLATRMLQAYSEVGLNRPAGAAGAAEVVANARPSAQAFLQLATYASLAGQSRKAELAGDKALELASPGQRSTVEKQLKQVKQARSGAGASSAPSAGGAPSGR